MPTLREIEFGDLVVDAIEALGRRTGSRYTERGYVVYERYFRGDQPMKYVSREFARRFGQTLKSLVDNYCPLVVNTLASRLIVDSFTSSEDKEDKQITDLLNGTRFDATQRSIHKDAVLYGDAYVIVWPGIDNENRFYRQRPWCIAPVYDAADPERMLCAAKVWQVGTSQEKRLRITIYYEDRIERYITSGTESNGVNGATNLDLYDADGEEAVQSHDFEKVPVAHFANGVGLGEFGVSELHDVIPLQSMLNKQIYDLMVGMESVSWAQRYVSGLEPIIDPATGQPDDKMFLQSRIWATRNKDAKFGQLDGPDPTPIVAAIESTRMEISRVKSIPAYYLGMSGDVPSGAALRVTEAPLVALVEDRQVHFGNVWENIVSLALGLDDDLSSVWRDTSPVSFSEQLDAGLSMKALGLPAGYVLERTLGVTPDEAKALVKERAEEDKAKADEQMRLATRAPMMP